MTGESPSVTRLKAENEKLRELVNDLASRYLIEVDGRFQGHLSTRVNEATGRG